MNTTLLGLHAVGLRCSYRIQSGDTAGIRANSQKLLLGEGLPGRRGRDNQKLLRVTSEEPDKEEFQLGRQGGGPALTLRNVSHWISNWGLLTPAEGLSSLVGHLSGETASAALRDRESVAANNLITVFLPSPTDKAWSCSPERLSRGGMSSGWCLVRPVQPAREKAQQQLVLSPSSILTPRGVKQGFCGPRGSRGL